MPLRHSGDFPFENPNRTTSMCNLEVFQTVGQTLVLATEIERNPAMSIENCPHILATIVQRTFDLDIETLMFVTHFGPMSYAPGVWPTNAPDTYSLVNFKWFTDLGATGQPCWTAQQPQWRYITEQEVIALLCQLSDIIEHEGTAVRQAEDVLRNYLQGGEHNAR